MKTIALMAIMFCAHQCLAQNPDSMSKKWNLDTNSKRWNNDTSNLQRPADTTRKNYDKAALNSNGEWKNRDSSLGQSKTKWEKDSAMAKKITMPDNGGSNTMAGTDSVKLIVEDRVIMKNGQMVIVKNGEEMKMEKNLTLPSGTVITTGGTVKKKDGTETKLKDGQYIALPSPKADNKDQKKLKENKKNNKESR